MSECGSERSKIIVVVSKCDCLRLVVRRGMGGTRGRAKGGYIKGYWS